MFFDVTVPLEETMATWPGDPKCQLKNIRRIGRGDKFNLTQISMSTHNATHIDAPHHLIRGGRTADRLDLNVLIGRARVVEIFAKEAITRSILETSDCRGETRVLFKTRNSKLWRKKEFVKDYVYITPDAAKYLVEVGVRLVGFDYLSVDGYAADDLPTHRVLLSKEIILVEGLNFSQVKPGPYDLYCLPLKIQNGDGAPARVILKKV